AGQRRDLIRGLSGQPPASRHARSPRLGAVGCRPRVLAPSAPRDQATHGPFARDPKPRRQAARDANGALPVRSLQPWLSTIAAHLPTSERVVVAGRWRLVSCLSLPVFEPGRHALVLKHGRARLDGGDAKVETIPPPGAADAVLANAQNGYRKERAGLLAR